MFARMLIPRTTAVQCGHDGSRREQQEFNGAKSSAGSSNLCGSVSARANFAEQDGESNPAGEPEDHGDGLDSENGEFVGRVREPQGRDDEICHGQEGPSVMMLLNL